MKYILEGPQADVVLQENRYRIAMGMVKITPVADEVEGPVEEAPVEEAEEDTTEVPAEAEKAEPETEVSDTKDVAPADEKKPAKKGKK